MKVTKQETLYHEDHGATLKHMCGKKDSSIVPFHLFFWAFLFWPFSFFYWDNALLNDDHHTSIYLELNDYNSILEQSMTLYEEHGATLKHNIWDSLYHGATLKHSVEKKGIAALPFFGPSFFSLAFLFFHLGQCSIKWWSSHFYLFTTQWLQLDTKTKYDSIWMPPADYRDMQWIKSDKYEKLWTVALPQILCQLHDHAKQYDNDELDGGKLHGNISQNGYGNAIIGRYGGCFEEGIW